MKYLLPIKEKFQKGQAVLVVLLVMSVLLTLGLSAVSRSVTDIKISQQTQESARAFWTAQAGLEKALLAQGTAGGEIDGVTYEVTKTQLGGSADFVFSEGVGVGENFVYWLVDHDSDGNIGTNFYSRDKLTVYWGNYWGNSADSPAPALVATLIYKDTGGNFRSRKFAFDPSVRSPATNFSSPDSGTDHFFGENIFAYKATISGLPSLPGYGEPYFVNIRMIYNTIPQILGIQTEESGFVQGYCYESTAKVAVSNIVRKLRECRTWPKTPGIFDYLLFSGGDLNQ